MKKKLEAELISLAHRILQLKNKSDIAVLQQEAQKLYEKLSVLRFVEENFGDTKPTIGQADIEEKIGKAFDYDEKVVVGQIAAADETDNADTAGSPIDVPSASDISSLVENLAASKTVNDETPVAYPQEDLQEESETGDAEESTEEGEEAQTEETPTLDEGTAFKQPESIEEVQTAETETNTLETAPQVAEGEDFTWEKAAEAELPPAGTNTEVPAATAQQDVFIPSFELSFEPKEETKIPDTPAPQFTFDDLLGKDYADPIFVKREELEKAAEPEEEREKEEELPAAVPEPVFEAVQEAEKPKETAETDIWSRRPFETQASADAERTQTLNDRLSKGITIGLNDRVAFMKNLFNNSSEDYNRVLSQLITFDTYTDARNFIDEMVKPDYNNWEGKEEYEQRFMEIVEKRFS